MCLSHCYAPAVRDRETGSHICRLIQDEDSTREKKTNGGQLASKSHLTAGLMRAARLDLEPKWNSSSRAPDHIYKSLSDSLAKRVHLHAMEYL